MGDHDLFDRLNTIRDEIDALKFHLSRMCEPSRELSLALTKLDEARLWAHEAISIPAYHPHFHTTNGSTQ